MRNTQNDIFLRIWPAILDADKDNCLDYKQMRAQLIAQGFKFRHEGCGFEFADCNKENPYLYKLYIKEF